MLLFLFTLESLSSGWMFSTYNSAVLSSRILTAISASCLLWERPDKDTKKIQISQGCMKKDWAILPKWLTKQQIMKRILRQHKRTSLANRQGKRRGCLLTLRSASPSANTSNSSATSPQSLEILTHHPDPDYFFPPSEFSIFSRKSIRL